LFLSPASSAETLLDVPIPSGGEKNRGAIDYSKIALYCSAAIALAISIGSLAGLESTGWFKDRIGVLSLLLVSMLILFLATNVDGRLAKLEAQSKRIAERSLESSLCEVQSSLPPALGKLFAPFLQRWTGSLKQAVIEHKLRLEPVEHFPHFYRATLAAFAHEHFLATSLASREFFWKNAPLLEAIKTFIDGGGSMTRIFFLDSAAREEDDGVREIILEQLNAGVVVHTIDSSKVPDDWQRTFVVAEKEVFAWTVTINARGRIASVEATADGQQVEEYRHLFGRLRHDASVRKWDTKDFG
jgi:hypothetical protein